MERLEVRITPANVNWTGAVNNLMSVPGNYAGAVAAGDTIVFDPAILGKGPGFNNPKADAAGAGVSLQFTAGYTGALEVAANYTASQIDLYGNSGVQRITVDNGFTLTANIIWMYASTGMKIDGPGSLAIVAAGGNAGYVTMVNTATIGVGAMTIDANSSMAISTTTLTLDGTKLTNFGAVNWLMGDIATPDEASVTNNGTFDITGGNHEYAFGIDFTNNGTFTTMIGPNAAVNFNSNFRSQAPGSLLWVESGNLWLKDGATVNTVVNVDYNADLHIATGFMAESGAVITGKGVVEVNDGAIYVADGDVLAVEPLVRLVELGKLDGVGLYILNGGLYSAGGRIEGTTVNAASIYVEDASNGMAGGPP